MSLDERFGLDALSWKELSRCLGWYEAQAEWVGPRPGLGKVESGGSTSG